MGRGVPWDATDEIASADAVVNLTGENIGARWTERRKKRIMESRVDGTTRLVEAMRGAPDKRRVFVSASAVGYYGLRGDEMVDESSAAGSGFLAEVTRRWEEAARGAEPFARVVILRFGVVLGRGGGALAKMMLPFRFGVGGRVGSGRQWMSWVDVEDVVRAMEWAMDNEKVRGTYNITSPEPARNADFARTLGRVMRRPSFFPAPGLALRLIFGQMAEETLLGGQRVLPRRATAEGFTFRYPTLEASLRHATI